MRLRSLPAGIAIVITALPILAAEKSPISRKIDSFSLQDYRGREHALKDCKDSKLAKLAKEFKALPPFAKRLVEEYIKNMP